MVKHLNDHPVYSSFDKKLREASMHNLHENGPFGHTSHVHINSSGGIFVGRFFISFFGFGKIRGVDFSVFVFGSLFSCLGI